MAEDKIRYDIRAQNALRDVIRSVLQEVAEHGLPGEHHFYITFDTNARGVSISDALKERHPEEMTIVLQNQFWDLEATKKSFSVTLSFANVPERLVIPFAAVRSFLDPSVQFGLQFEQHAPAPAAETAEDAADAAPEEKPQTEDAEAETAQSAAGGADVVNLESFRKKP